MTWHSLSILFETGHKDWKELSSLQSIRLQWRSFRCSGRASSLSSFLNAYFSCHSDMRRKICLHGWKWRNAELFWNDWVQVSTLQKSVWLLWFGYFDNVVLIVFSWPGHTWCVIVGISPGVNHENSDTLRNMESQNADVAPAMWVHDPHSYNRI